jgi:hypothetical protein
MPEPSRDRYSVGSTSDQRASVAVPQGVRRDPWQVPSGGKALPILRDPVRVPGLALDRPEDIPFVWQPPDPKRKPYFELRLRVLAGDADRSRAFIVVIECRGYARP